MVDENWFVFGVLLVNDYFHRNNLCILLIENQIEMEKNSHSFLSSFSKSKIVSPSTTFKNSQQIFNYLSWKNGKQTKGNLGKALTNQKSLNNISGLRTLLGDMSRLKENMLHSARSWDKNSKSNNKNSQSYER